MSRCFLAIDCWTQITHDENIAIFKLNFIELIDSSRAINLIRIAKKTTEVAVPGTRK